MIAQRPLVCTDLTTSIEAAVCQAAGVSPDDLRSRYRATAIVAARMAIVVLLRRYTPMSYPCIARWFARQEGTGTYRTIAQRWKNRHTHANPATTRAAWLVETAEPHIDRRLHAVAARDL